MAEVTRNKIGYATAGENSFFPTSAVLALFPFFQGTRNPNFFGQQWWGSWHLCEMLGYVGLVTLALAMGAIWRLYRKQKVKESSDFGFRISDFGLQSVVRVWTWIIIGGGVFMLGYYLPTYRLVHMLPVLGVVRCPARMVWGVDMGLATLAAIAIHCLLTQPHHERIRRLARTVMVTAVVVLPLAMIVMARGWGFIGLMMLDNYPDQFPYLPFVGGAKAAIEAARITNPAVYVPAIMMALTAAVLVVWLKRAAASEPRPEGSGLAVSASEPRRKGAVLPFLLASRAGRERSCRFC